MKWQPIETAPKHVDVIIALWKHDVNGGERVYDIARQDENGEWMEAFGGIGIFIWSPTHWMPLPSTPELRHDIPESA